MTTDEADRLVGSGYPPDVILGVQTQVLMLALHPLNSVFLAQSTAPNLFEKGSHYVSRGWPHTLPASATRVLESESAHTGFPGLVQGLLTDT